MSLQRLYGLLVFIIPPLLWTGNVIIARVVRDDIAPLTLSSARWLISLVLLLPFALPHFRSQFPLYRRHKALLFGTSLTGIAAFNTLVYTGLHHTGSTNALLLNSCIPVLIMLLGALFYREPLNRRQGAGLLLSLAGVAAIVLQGSWQRLAALQVNQGDLWILAAVLCWAFYTIWMRRIPPEINRTALTALQISIGLFLLTPFTLWEWTTMPSAPLVFNQNALLALVYIGIFPSVAAYLCYNAAIARFGAVRAGLSIHLMPVFGSILAVTLLGETFHLYHLAGISAIFTGIFLCSKKTL
ncbi:MAG: DMT family transporter [Neisseria sp.]|nr:DMT family transporter [Neisseria sp.]